VNAPTLDVTQRHLIDIGPSNLDIEDRLTTRRNGSQCSQPTPSPAEQADLIHNAQLVRFVSAT
jgi:hypothetical protein